MHNKNIYDYVETKLIPSPAWCLIPFEKNISYEIKNSDDLMRNPNPRKLIDII